MIILITNTPNPSHDSLYAYYNIVTNYSTLWQTLPTLTATNFEELKWNIFVGEVSLTYYVILSDYTKPLLIFLKENYPEFLI